MSQRFPVWSALALACSCFGTAISVAGQPQIGAEFPDFRAKELLTGEEFSLSDFRGDVVVVDFWATWCGPCIGELPNVRKAYAEYHEQGLQMIGISLDRSIGACKQFIEQRGIPWYHIADGKFWKAELAVKNGIKSIPAMFVVGRDGVVTAAHPRGEALQEAIADALAEPYSGPKGRLAGSRRPLSGTPAAGESAGESARANEKPSEPIERADQWLTIARSMETNKNYRVARRYYNKVIEVFPGTEQAEKAQAALKHLPE